MLDTKGPEIRCHYFKNGGVTIEKDSIVRIGMDEVWGMKDYFLLPILVFLMISK